MSWEKKFEVIGLGLNFSIKLAPVSFLPYVWFILKFDILIMSELQMRSVPHVVSDKRYEKCHSFSSQIPKIHYLLIPEFINCLNTLD